MNAVRYAPQVDDGGKVRIMVAADCANMGRWVNGTWRAYNPKFHIPLGMALDSIESLRRSGARPASDNSDWLDYVPRGHSSAADYGARRRPDRCTLEHIFPWPQEPQVRVDGGVSSAGGAGCGWVLWGRAGDGHTMEWRRIAAGSWPLLEHLTPVETEFLGLISALRFLTAALQAGATERRRSPGGIDTDYIKAKARPQRWSGTSRCRVSPLPRTATTAARRRQPGDDLDDDAGVLEDQRRPTKQTRLSWLS